MAPASDPVAAGVGAEEVPHRGGAGPPRPLPVQHDPSAQALLVRRGCSSVPGGISSGMRPPRPTPPSKKPRQVAARPPTVVFPVPRPTASPPGDVLHQRQEEPSRRPNAVWDARSSASSPELGYDGDFISTSTSAFYWAPHSANANDSMASTSQPLMDLLIQDSDTDLELLTAPLDVTQKSYDGKGPSKRGSNYRHEEDIQLCVSWMNVSYDQKSYDGKGPSKRGSNYRHEEDIQLCVSWMNVSYDPIVGNEQPTKSYYQRIADDFHNNRDFESNRSTKSLELRIAVILKDCMKFQSFYEEIERRHPSGVTYQEHLSEAQARFANASKGKTCQFIHCWLKVRHSEKFAAARINVGSSRPAAKSMDINLNVPAGSQAADDEGQEVGQGQEQSKTARPPGRKKSKERLKKSEGEDQYMGLMKNLLDMKAEEHAMKKEIWANEMRDQEQSKKTKELEESRRLQLQERKLEIEHQRLMWDQEREVMFCDVTKMDEHQRAYVMAKRAELAKAACANVGESTSVGESFVRPE